MASTITDVGHGFIAGDPIYFGNLVPSDCGIVEGRTYYVLAAGLTSDTFEFSETDGGTPFDLTFDITEGIVSAVAVYTPSDDPAEPVPTIPPTPTAPTVTSAVVSGIVRLRVEVNDIAEDKVRGWEVQVTHKFDATDPDWTTPLVLNLPEGSTEVSIPALGSTVYAVRLRAVDVFGNASAFSAEVTHTTLAGSDALAAALANLANDVSDGIITETKIADNAISTPKLQAGSVTAQVLAATIVLASLIKTADTGRRIEVDVDGIRLYDASEVLLVRIPTNGDPVYVKGQVAADTLVSQTAASFRTAASLEGSAVMTLQNGISAPTVAPVLAASVDSLALTSTPTDIATAHGFTHTGAGGTFWIAADPTQAGGYVAHEFNDTTGAYIRSITKTGSVSTVTTTLGSTSHVSDTAAGSTGTTDSQVATPLTMPRDGTITKVSVYMAGRSGSCTAKVGVWNTSNVLLRESASFTASSGGATTVGASDHYDRALTSPLAVTSGTTYRVGFIRTSSSDGFQWDRDDGAGKTQYRGDGLDGNLSSVTTDTTHKPNVYITYTYTVSTAVETAPMIGITYDGSYIYTLDNLGNVFKYDKTTLALVSHASVAASIAGNPAAAGLMYEAGGGGHLVVITATGLTASEQTRFLFVDTTTLTVASSSNGSGLTINGSTTTTRGGTRVNDALSGGAGTYWISVSGTVRAFNATTLAYVANRDFGTSATALNGITHDGTQFRGWAVGTPTKVWKFSAWDWTTASAIYWIGYAWYDSVGTTHETVLGPRTSITMRRRERVQVQNPAIPTGGADDPDKARIYMLPGASDLVAGTAWLQVTDALTARYLITYTSSGTHDGAGTAFPAGTPAELKSAATGWSLKGSGLANFGGTSFPASPATNDQFYRTDLAMWFYWDGTRWLSTQLFHYSLSTGDAGYGAGLSATFNSERAAAPHLSGGTDLYIVNVSTDFLVNSGGTALGASHSWIGTLLGITDGGTATTTLATLTINSGASAVARNVSVAVNTLMNNGTVKRALNVTWTKTGTPGAMRYSPVMLTYRIVMT